MPTWYKAILKSITQSKFSITDKINPVFKVLPFDRWKNRLKQLLQNHTASKWQTVNANSGLLMDFYSQKAKETKKQKSGDEGYDCNVGMAAESHKSLSPGLVDSASWNNTPTRRASQSYWGSTSCQEVLWKVQCYINRGEITLLTKPMTVLNSRNSSTIPWTCHGYFFSRQKNSAIQEESWLNLNYSVCDT